jgi:hypothetical protein
MQSQLNLAVAARTRTHLWPEAAFSAKIKSAEQII